MSIEVENNLENEILPADELAVSRAVAGLKHVEAPANFERRVLSKISEGESARHGQFRIPLALAYSLPLLLVLIIAIAFVVNSNFRNGPPTNPEVAVNTATTNSRDTSQPLAGHDSESASQPPVTASALPSTTSETPGSMAPRKTDTPRRNDKVRPTGGSIDEAVNSVRSILPKGIGDQQFPANRDDVMSTTPVPVSEVLQQIGITAQYKDGWVVRSVTADSKARVSGVKVGDIVLALGKTVLSANTEFKGSFDAAFIRIRRSGQDLEIPLK